MLLARGGDPLATAAEQVHAARRAIVELLQVLPPDQEDLAAQFRSAGAALDHGLAVLSTWQVPPKQLAALRRTSTGFWGEPLLHGDVWVGTQPVDESETVYGFASAMPALLERLHQSVGAVAEDVHPGDGPRMVARAAALAEFATRVEAAVLSFTAAVWEYERPTMPVLPAGTSQVRLRSGPRARPCRRWARRAEVLFLPGRVEIVTSTGTTTIGQRRPVATLLHVVPPSPRAVRLPYDPREQYEQIPLQDELGVVHFCSAEGYSLGAIMVADWLAQPEFQVAQHRLSSDPDSATVAHDRLIWGLHVSGIAHGAAVLDLPVRRGVMHPPPSADAPEGPVPGGAGSDAAPNPVPLVRPGPHRLPYRGMAALPSSALARRRRRMGVWGNDTGPASPLNLVLRAVAPVMAWAGGLGTAYLFAETLWARVAVLWTVLAVAEPWLWWAVQWFRDRQALAPRAVYRPGRYPSGTRAFASRAALIAEGEDIAVRGPFGHMAWAPGPRRKDGVHQLHQLRDEDGPWAAALVDRSGRWQFVLPAHQWAPGGDFGPLAGFARAAGLTVQEAYARRMSPAQDVFDDRTPLARRVSTGPASRGLLTLGVWCALVAPLTWWGWHVATALLVALTAGAVVPVAIRSWWHRHQQHRT